MSRKGTEEKKGKICTAKELSEDFREFKLVRLISPEDRRLPKFFNDRASHTNKTDKSNLNNVPASRNRLSFETTVEQKINVPDNWWSKFSKSFSVSK